MKKGILAFAIGFIGLTSQAQDSTSFFAEEGDGALVLKRYIDVDMGAGSDLQLNESWTIEAMIRLPVGYNNDQIYIVEAYDGNTANGGFVLRVSNQRLQAYAMSSGGLTSVNGITPIQEDTWTHITATYNEPAGVMALYVNGFLDIEQQISVDQHCNLQTMRIGARGDDADVSQATLIDEVRIFEVARDTGSIRSTMDKCLQGNEPELVAYYTFEDESGGTITDRTSNGFDGVIVNNLVVGSFQNGAYWCPLNVSIDETSLAPISVFPNPATSTLTVNSEYKIEEVQIFNLAGVLVQSERNSNFSVQNLEAGVYILKVKTENGIAQSRFVKQ